MCVCVCACVRACMRACVRVCLGHVSGCAYACHIIDACCSSLTMDLGPHTCIAISND